jgi:hypothetical protein
MRAKAEAVGEVGRGGESGSGRIRSHRPACSFFWRNKKINQGRGEKTGGGGEGKWDGRLVERWESER